MFFISYYNTKGTKGATNLAAGEIYTKNWLNCENVKTKIDITKFPILLLTLYIAESLKCFLFFFFLYYFLFIIIGKLESKAATSSSIFYVFAVTFYLFWMHFHYLIRLGAPSRCLPHCLPHCLRLSLLGATEQRGEAKESHPTKELRLDEILLRRRCGHRDPRRIGGFTAALLLHYPGRAHLHNGVSRLDGCGGARRNGAWQR